MTMLRQYARCLVPVGIAFWLSGCGGDTRGASEYVAAHALAIRSLTDSEDFSDLQPLADAVGTARIVQLGESSHGSGTMSLLKTRLIRFLHEQRGFNVIAFESSLFACSRGLEREAAIDAQALMRSCVSDGSYTAEMLPLFEYIKSTQHSTNPLRLAGIDVQPSVESAAALEVFFRGVAAGLDERQRAALLDTVAVVHALQVDGNRCMGWNDRDACQRTRARHDGVRASLRDQLPLAGLLVGADRVLAGMLLESWMDAVDWQLERTRSNGHWYGRRDAGMAANAGGLIERLHPGQKLVVWAHNSHIAGDYPSNSLRRRQEAVMGMHLRKAYGSDLYTIGLFMLAGSQADNSRRITAVTAHRPGSLEGLFMPLSSPASFMALPAGDESGSGNEWLLRPIIYKDWGRTENKAILGRAFDAIMMVRDSTPPHYLPRRSP
jgi:erythromycin esterase